MELFVIQKVRKCSGSAGFSSRVLSNGRNGEAEGTFSTQKMVISQHIRNKLFKMLTSVASYVYNALKHSIYPD